MVQILSAYDALNEMPFVIELPKKPNYFMVTSCLLFHASFITAVRSYFGSHPLLFLVSVV